MPGESGVHTLRRALDGRSGRPGLGLGIGLGLGLGGLYLRLGDLPVEVATRAMQPHDTIDEVQAIDVAPVVATRAQGR